QYVRGFQVAMHNARAVSVGDRLGQHQRPLNGWLDRDLMLGSGFLPQPDRQAGPGAQFLDDVRQSPRFAEFVDWNDVRMAQRGQRLGLAHEALLGLARKESLGPGNLESDQSPQPRIARSEHGSRAP